MAAPAAWRRAARDPCLPAVRQAQAWVATGSEGTRNMLDTLAEQDVAQRRQALERIVRRSPQHLDDAGWLEDGAGG